MVIFKHDGKVLCDNMQWGMLPEYEETQSGNIPVLTNARAEGIYSQNAFRFSFRKRRCLVPMDSFYVHHALQANDLAYRVTHLSEEIVYAAGVWSSYIDNNETIAGFCILNCNSNRDLSDIMPRMPLILKNKEEARLWLDAEEIRDLANVISIPESYKFRYYHIANKLHEKLDSPILHEVEKRDITLFDS